MPRDDSSNTESFATRIDRLIGKKERNQQNLLDTPELRMAHDIRHAYQTEGDEDARSLQRVLSRLTESSAATRSQTIFSPSTNQFQQRMPEVQIPLHSFTRRRSKQASGWMNHLSQLAAVLFLVLLVGGLLTTLYATRARPATSGGNATKSAQGAIYNSNYAPIDQVYCDQLEHSVLHIHAHISIYIDGRRVPIPANVGIPQDVIGLPACYYWLHTHDTSGVIHIESPTKKTFIFGQFRDEWYQKFQNLGFPSQLLRSSGWTIWLNGHPYAGSLKSIPLAAHNLITIAYNSPHAKPDTYYAWGGL